MIPDIPNYNVNECIYEGQRTFVCRATRKKDLHKVIIKMHKEEHPTQRSVAQLKHEYEIMRKIDSPLILKIYGYESLQDRGMLILEDFEGIPLSKVLLHEKMSLERFFPLAISLAEALGQIHHQHIIHKDIKPQNIIINTSTNQVKITDFGISTLLSRKMQPVGRPNILEGTIAYISPEQTGRMNVAVGYRADIYSLGITLYEMLAGHVPFESKDFIELMHCHLAMDPKPLHELGLKIPKPLSDIIAKCLAKNAEDRYHSAYGVKRDLQECYNQWQEHAGNIPQLFLETFQPGQNDVYDHFQIPQKLYGREREVTLLKELFNHCYEDTEVAFVLGYPGIGKSSVVNEIQKYVAQNRGYFISGKCEQFKLNIPYHPIILAFQNLIQQILSESDEQLGVWRTNLLKALGRNGQVMIDILPDLELIIGKQPSLTKIDIRDREVLFKNVFLNFVKVFLQRESPLVIFIDDLQWIDTSSLFLLQFLLKNISLKNLFFIGSFRNNDSASIEFLQEMIKDIRNYHQVHILEIDALSKESVAKFIGDTFHSPPTHVMPLAELVYQKTQGNPFFVTQFLKALYQENLLNFEPSTQQWEVNLARIKHFQVTDNVAELMSKRIQNLSPEAQEILKIASVIGSTFDLKTLADVQNIPIETIAYNLQQAVEEDIIYSFEPMQEEKLQENEVVTVGGLLTDSSSYAFQHDRIQQVIYQLLSEKDVKSYHLKVGRALINYLPETKVKEKILQGINHLNLGVEFIADEKEKEQIAQYNLKAAEYALDSYAYTAAEQYGWQGIHLLTEDCWEKKYTLSFALHLKYAIASLMTGKIQQASQIFERLLSYSKNDLDRGQIYYFKIILNMNQGQMKNAVAIGAEALKALGVPAPNVIKLSDIQWERRKLDLRMLLHSPDYFLTTPTTHDEKTILLASIYRLITFAGFDSHQSGMFYWALIKGLDLILAKGITVESCSSLMRYIAFLWTPKIHRNWKKTITYSHVALKLAERFPNTASYFNTFIAYDLWIHPWKAPYKYVAESLETWVLRCFQAGISLPAANGYLFYLWYTFISGLSIPEVKKKCIDATEKTKLLNVPMTLNRLNIIDEACDLLMGLSDEHEAAVFQDITTAIKFKGDESIVEFTDFWEYLSKIFVTYLFDDYTSCLMLCQKVMKKYFEHYPGIILWQHFHFYHALTLAHATAENADDTEAKNQLTHYERQFKAWAEICPHNFRHRYYLVAAEASHSCGDKQKTIHLYEIAITAALESGIIYEHALALELLAKYYLSLNRKTLARFYLTEALQCYAIWGAKAKVKRLQAKYESILTKRLPHVHPIDITKESTESVTTSTIVPTTMRDVFDETALFQSAHILSEERNVPSLLQNFMHIVMTYAGGDKAIIFLVEDNQLYLHAETILGQRNAMTKKESLEQAEGRFSMSIVQYCLRKKDMILLDDVSEEGRYLQDPYIASNGVKSILCLPLTLHGKISGILYLENKKTKNVFGKRITLLKLLSSQIAISLENAQFYATLEGKIEEHAKELQQTFLQWSQKEKAASIGTMATGIALELQHPLTEIADNSSNSLSAIEQIELLLQRNSSNSLETQDSAHQLKANLEDIYNQGKRAKQIIKKMLAHSKADDVIPRAVNLHTLIDTSLKSVHQSYIKENPHLAVKIIKELDPMIEDVELIQEAMGMVFEHLIQNAYESMLKKQQQIKGYSPTLTIRTHYYGKKIEIHIRDNGLGIPTSLHQKIFSPLFTTKAAGQGSGFGLSLSYNIIVQQHGGSLTFHTKEGEYAEFVIVLTASY